MRSRILENLYNLSDKKNQNPDHLKDLMDRHQLTEIQVRRRAALILRFLLHDYSRFSVSTIDSFFQSIVRSFAKEMGLPIGFRLELQPNQIMTQAIDRVILEMDQPGHADLKNWLIEFVETKMEQDKGWNIVREIRQISEAIYSEIFQQNALALWKELGDKGMLTQYKQTLRKIISHADVQIQRIGKSGQALIQQHGLNILEDFFRKSGTPVKVFLKWRR
jgi:ATP-dependent helicase/nuclease subunit A